MNLSKYRLGGSVLLIVFGLFFACFSLFRIDLPGLYYDECIFIHAALGGTSGPFIYKSVAGFPVMIMAYIGALKSYLYLPVFYFFGVTPATIRVPVIILTLCTLGCAFALVRRLSGRTSALFFIGILATDPALIYSVRLDYGPVAIMLFLKMSALYLFFKMIETGRPCYGWLLCAALTLGIYDKLNFVWFVTAFGLSAWLIYRESFQRTFAANKKGFLPPFAAFMCLFSLEIIFLIRPALSYDTGAANDFSFLERARNLLSVYTNTMNGNAQFTGIVAGGYGPATIINYLLLPTFLGLILLFLTRKTRPRTTVDCRSPWFFCTLFVLISMQILITKQAGGPHHMMMLYPFHLLIFFSLVPAIQPLVRAPYTKWASGGFIGIYLLIMSFNLQADVGYASAFQAENEFNPSWSPAIYQLSELLNRNPSDAVVCADWGLQTCLFSLADPADRDKYLEASGDLKRLNPDDPGHMEFIYRKYFAGRNVFVVMHAENCEVVKNVNRNFGRLYDAYFRQSGTCREICTPSGRKIYRVCYIPANGRP